MVDGPPQIERGGPSGSRRTSAPFVLMGEVSFGPRYFPERIQVTKERELDRTSNFCRGEDVSDKGAKNRDIHINGKLLGFEKEALDNVADHRGTYTMSSATWSGEVRVKTIEYEGPVSFHPPSGSLFWEYTMDLVSTGRDETPSSSESGVISDGSDQGDEGRPRGNVR